MPETILMKSIQKIMLIIYSRRIIFFNINYKHKIYQFDFFMRENNTGSILLQSPIQQILNILTFLMKTI